MRPVRATLVTAACVLSGCIYGINPDWDDDVAGGSSEMPAEGTTVDATDADASESSETSVDGDGDPGDGDPGDGDPGDGDPGDGDGDIGDGDGDGDPGELGCPIADPDLVACYEYEQVDGGVLEDSSSYANHGWASDVAVTPGVSGDAGVFASESMTSVPDAPSITIAGAMTIETWIFVDALPPNSYWGVLDKSGEYRMSVEFNATVRCQFGESTDMTMAITPGQWQHFACVWTGAAILGYEDGQLAGQRNAAPMFNPQGDPLILGNQDGYSKALEGSLDRTAIWQRERSQAELCASAWPACP